MMDYIEKAASFLIPAECIEEYFVKYNFLSVPCFKITLSKCLSYGIILGSLLVKLPQIIKIYTNKSGAGINLFSVMLDLLAITIYTSYSFVKGFAFSSWGDSAFLAVQTLLVGLLVLIYGNKTTHAIAFGALYGLMCYIFMGGFTPVSFLWTLQGMNIPILLTGKLAQAWTNYKNGNTGQLSAATIIMLFAGSCARIFTSIQETGDSMIIITYLASTFANGVVLFQLLYYWNAEVVTDKKKK